MALGLFVLGVALENRPWALKLELLRLASNVPLVWLAPLVGLWPASAAGWVGLLSYSLLSVIGLYCCRSRLHSVGVLGVFDCGLLGRVKALRVGINLLGQAGILEASAQPQDQSPVPARRRAPIARTS